MVMAVSGRLEADVPLMMFVAGPVLLASAISRTGRRPEV